MNISIPSIYLNSNALYSSLKFKIVLTESGC